MNTHFHVCLLEGSVVTSGHSQKFSSYTKKKNNNNKKQSSEKYESFYISLMLLIYEANLKQLSKG